MPTNPPQDAEAHLPVVDDDDLDENERKELHAAIAAAEDELDLNLERGVSEDELWARLRAIP